MKKPRDKRAIVFMMLFILAVIFYIVSDAILQSNTLSAAKPSKASEYGQLVNWLPDKAKLAIEYRAKYLDFQKKAEIAKGIDAKVDALFAFADYIKVKDPKGSDKIMVSILETPEYQKSRRAYQALATLILNSKTKHPITIKDYHQHIDTLKWEEDKLQAWAAGLAQIQRLRGAPRAYLDFLAPLMQDVKEYRNYDRFYATIASQSNRIKDHETIDAATQIREKIKEKNISINNNLIKAELEYREIYSNLKESVVKATNPEEKNFAYTALAAHLFGYDNLEASGLLTALLNDPKCRSARNFYIPLSRLINERLAEDRITIADYQKYQSTIKRENDKLQAWEAGLNRLRELKSKDQVYVDFLLPLLNETPRFYDYKRFYEMLRDHATKCGNNEIAQRTITIVERMDADKELRNLGELIERGIIKED